MSTESYDERIAALKARIAQARAERDSVRAEAAAVEEKMRQERAQESSERHEWLSGQMRGISGELQKQSEHIRQEKTVVEGRDAQQTTDRESRAGRFTELTSTLSALRQSMQEDRERRKQHGTDVNQGRRAARCHISPC